MTAKNDLEKDPARPGRRVETRLRERGAFAWLAAAPSWREWLGDLLPDLLTLIVVGAIVRTVRRLRHTTNSLACSPRASG